MKSRLSRRALAVSAVAVGLAMFATTGPAAGAARPATHSVKIDGTAFAPVDLSVTTGDTIVWVNEDPYPHTATSAAGGFDSRSIAPGKSWKYVARTKGDFPYVCAIHPSMTGTVHVK